MSASQGPTQAAQPGVRTHRPRFSSPGEYSYLGTTLRQVSVEPMPSLLDVRQLVTLYGILPLGEAPRALPGPFRKPAPPVPALTLSSWGSWPPWWLPLPPEF